MTTTARKGSAEKTGIPHTRLEEEGLIWAQYYEQGRKLGQGAFGKVHLGTHKSTGAQWAIKTVNKEKVCVFEVLLDSPARFVQLVARLGLGSGVSMFNSQVQQILSLAVSN